MRNFQEKGKVWKFMQSPPMLVFLGILVLIFAWSVIGLFGKMRETAEKKRIPENKVAELEQMKEKLSADIEKLNTEAGVEEVIRDKFGLAKEGEKLIVVVEDKNGEQVESEENKGGFLSFFRNIFR